ncbi:MAG: fibronectin type III-like domain-contianing protein [Deinococcales bacterium]
MGEYEGDEVVQLYIRHHGASVTRPVKELKGFKRLHLAVGETQTLRFRLFADQLGYYDREMNYGLDADELEIFVGTFSQDLPLSQRVKLYQGALAQKVFFSEAEIV